MVFNGTIGHSTDDGVYIPDDDNPEYKSWKAWMLTGSLIRIRSESELELDFLSASCSPAISPPCAPSPPNATLVQCLPPLILAASLPAKLCFKSPYVVHYVVHGDSSACWKSFIPSRSHPSHQIVRCWQHHYILSIFEHVQSVPTIFNQVGWSNNIAGLEQHTLHLTWQPTCFAAGVSEWERLTLLMIVLAWKTILILCKVALASCNQSLKPWHPHLALVPPVTNITVKL